MMSSRRLHALLMGFAVVGAMSLPTHAQLLVGSNGSQTPLAPTKLTKRTAKSSRILSTTTLKTNFVASPNQYFVLHMPQAPVAAVQAKLATHAKLIHYIPDGFYLYATADAQTAIAKMRAATLGEVVIAGEGNVPAAFKLETRLYQALHAGQLPEGIKGVMVYPNQESDASALFRTLDRWGIAYQAIAQAALLTSPTLTQVEQIAAIPYVSGLSIEETPVEQFLHTETLMQTNAIDIVNYDRKGPIGDSVYFVNWETYGQEPEYLINTYGRNIEGLTDNRRNAHGTNCGLIVSSANNILEYQNIGMAPGTINLSGNLGIDGLWHHAAVPSQMQQGYSPLVSNHSVGWYSGVHPYDGNARMVDQSINTNAYMCVYPTGNYAYGRHYWGPYKEGITPDVADYGNITGTIKTNKNGLAVHSTLFPGTDVTWASFGPTFDGRMKPEICAQGIGGTSYASPGVAGMFAVLLDQWKRSYPDEPARVDICKAVMLNTAMDVRTYVGNVEAGFGIDYRTGYGQISPLFSVNSIKDGRVKYDASIGTGETQDFQITVPAGQTELRVMLLWNDPAAAAGVSKALINDLDLEVIAPDATTFLPWTLDPSPTQVTFPAKRKVNRHDNHERVVITAPNKNEALPAGNYTIRVKGHSVPQGPQNYVLTWQWRERGIVMTSIPEGFRLQPNQEVTLSWDMQLAANEERQATNWKKGAMTPVVEYRTSPSEPWTICEPNQGFVYNAKGDGSPIYGHQRGKNFFRWRVPANLQPTSTLQFRVSVDDLSAETNNAHVNVGMARPTLLSLSPQQVKLSWTPLEGVATGKYMIYALYEKYMTIVDSVDATTHEKVVTAPAGHAWSNKHFFAIAHKTETGALGQRSAPVGLDQFNPLVTNESDRWESTYTLCHGDTLALTAGHLEGTVTWYKNEVSLPTTERTLNLTRDDVGRYKYSITNAGEVVFTSKETSINKSAVELSDTAEWGFGKWNGYVFKRNTTDFQPPLLGADAKFYGKFSLNRFAFNSHTDLFPWEKYNIALTPGYVGCPTEGNSRAYVIVMKRTGFARGTYTFTMQRVSGNAEIIVRDPKGTQQMYHISGQNQFNKVLPSVRLDETSTVEIHWVGNHFALDVTANLYGVGYSPAKVATNLAYWLEPNALVAQDGEVVRHITSAKPTFETLAAEGADAPATRVANGSNYNATLRFNGTGGYTGMSPNTSDLTATTDFVVAHVDAETPGETRLLTFGLAGATSDVTSDSTYAVMLNGGKVLSTTRGGTSIANGNYSAGRLALLTVRHAKDKKSELLYNGTKVKAVANAAKTTNLVLQRMALGTDFDPATDNYLKGDLSEAIHYTGTLTEQQENSVRTYLAIKHGLTIDHNYVDGAKVLYPVNSYAHQIVGLGQSVLSRLSQRQSKGQLTATTPSTSILAVGNLAATNAENTSKLTEGKYYIMGANMAYKAARYRGTRTIADPTFRLITTKPATAAYDELSLYIPKAELQRESYTPVLLLDTLTTRLNSVETASKKVVFEDYDETYMCARFTPMTDSCFVRVAWDVTTGVASALAEGESVVWEAEAEVLRVGIPTAMAIEVYDATGRLALRHTTSGVQQVSTAVLPSGVYILKIQRSNGTIYSDKLAIFR